jgi:mannose-6-phosphate isomerase-like protein (cupin superfamily)
MIVRGIAARAVFSSRKMGKSELLSGNQVFSGLNCFLPGQTHSLHTHAGQDKLYFVLEGRGSVTVGTNTETVRAGDLVLAREGVQHALENPGPDNLVVLAVMAPPPRAKRATSHR